MEQPVNDSKTPLSEEQAPKKVSHKKMIFYIVFFICLATLVVTLMLNLGDIKSMGKAFLAVWEGDHPGWLSLAILACLFYFIIYPTPLMLVSKKLGLKASIFDTWTIGASEHFYNGVTPSNAGGQPFQIYALTSCNVSASDASGAILVNYINVCICQNIWGLISLIYYPSYVSNLNNVDGNNLTGLGGIAIFGIILNFLNFAFFFLLGTSKKFRHALMRAFYFFCKWKWLGKKIGKHGPKIDKYLEDSQIAFMEIRHHLVAFSLSVLIRMVFLGILYSANFFLLNAVGCSISWSEYPKILLATAFATNCVSWFPTPGAIGAGELVSSIVISSVGGIGYSQGTAISLLWRLFSFYAILAFSLIVTFIFHARLNKRMNKQKK